MRAVAPSLLVVLVLSACGSTRTPGNVLSSYASALRSEDSDVGRELHTPEALQGIGGDRWEAHFAQRAAAYELLAERLDTASDSTFDYTATLPLPSGDAVTLTLENGQWRIVSGVGIAVDALTPRGTVAALVRAILTGDMTLMMSLVPPSYRADLTPQLLENWYASRRSELMATAALLQTNLDQDVDTSESSAVFRYGSRALQLVREEGIWYVEDFE